MTATTAVAPYLAATFADGAGQRQLYIFTSLDGNTLVDIAPNPVYSDNNTAAGGISGGAVGDPSIAYVGGTIGWVAAFTGSSGGGNGKSFRMISSPDLVTWTFLAEVDCTAACNAAPQNPSYPGTECWAPDLTLDTNGTVYIVVAINGTTLYWLKATNAALTQWSAPTILPISGVPQYVIDGSIIKVGNVYHCHYKNETTKFVGHATATAYTGPYTVEGETSTTQWAAPTSYTNGYEGPCVCPTADGKGYLMYVDDSANGGHGLMRSYSTDPTLKASSWGPVSGLYLPSGVRPRHGSVIPVLASQLPAATIHRMCVVDVALRT